MDLKSGYPYWAIKNGLMHAFPPLQKNLRCDVAIVGAGITGALIADELVDHDYSVIVVDQRDVGWGSTAASTALLQYEIDTHMVDLAKTYGESNAALAYLSCAEAIEMIQSKAAELRDVEFARMQSLYYASKRHHRRDLQEEFALRSKHGLDVEWVESEEMPSRFGFAATAAILSSQAARLDPYRMTYRLLRRLQKRGARVFDRTTIDRITGHSKNVALETTDGYRINAKHIVIAAGYASQQMLPKRVSRNRSSYAFVTDPIASHVLGPLAVTMVWESARPYLYMRVTGDGRLLVGGEDDAVDVPRKRDALVDTKAKILAQKVQRLFPNIPVTPAFAWAGTFAETSDGLPYFGRHPKLSGRIHFAMAYGGNGITYSMLGAQLLRASIERRNHPLSKLFSFDRTG
jgi:glycine/D-amino acid oxidase-like deaminating enzyme